MYGIFNCGFDLAGNLLNHLYGFYIGQRDITYRKDDSKFLVIDQSKYSNKSDAKLLDHGFLYVPNFCETNECPILIFFHGCNFSAKSKGSKPTRNSGLLNYASKNNLVILFP